MTDTREELRKIIFKASGGISDMANDEIDQIMSIVQSATEKAERTKEYDQIIFMSALLRATDGRISIPQRCFQEVSVGDEVVKYIEPETQATVFRLKSKEGAE